jgi:hypothetical protein
MNWYTNRCSAGEPRDMDTRDVTRESGLKQRGCKCFVGLAIRVCVMFEKDDRKPLFLILCTVVSWSETKIPSMQNQLAANPDLSAQIFHSVRGLQNQTDPDRRSNRHVSQNCANF